jgi:PiT family inorganic phosphate transporter
LLWVLIILALVFAFINGFRDSSSIVAGVISSHALPPRLALNLCGIAEFVAPFLFGIAVAKSITTDLINPAIISLDTITIAIAASLIWTVFAWFIGIPSSSSHALVGGILGAVLLVNGPRAIIVSGLYKVILPLFLTPILGFAAGYVLMNIIILATMKATPKVNSHFKHLQIITMIGLALSHSANDAQKSMGIITLGLLLAGKISSFNVPLLGRKIYVIRPINALASQLASSIVILSSAIFGAPVSTSQVVSMALIGAGSAERVNKVRWQVSTEMLTTWILTIPITMIIAAIFEELFITIL